MKKHYAALLALSLALTLFGCAQKPAEQGSPQDVPTQQAETLPESEQKPETETAWSYRLTTEKSEEEFRNDAGVLLASRSYELPRLEPACDGDVPPEKAPEAMRQICETFNRTVSAFHNGEIWGTQWDIGAEAKEHYQMREDDAEDPGHFVDELTVTEKRLAGDLVSVRAQAYINLGGAHPDWGYISWNYDLKTGEFFALSDLAANEGALCGEIAWEVIDQIALSEDVEAYNEDYMDQLEQTRDFHVYFGEDGLTVWFPEYEIATRIAGVPEFTVPYAKLDRFLNERGERLLALSEETHVTADFLEAHGLWSWMAGGAPTDYEDARSGSAQPGDESELNLYYRVNDPQVQTMAQLRERLSVHVDTAFVDSVLAAESAGEYPRFREFDGVLYCLGGGRGEDLSIGTVDYAVTMNPDGAGGTLAVTIHRKDWNGSSWYLTGKNDVHAFPFTLGEDGATFMEMEYLF